jgi:uncharacterized protein
MMAPTPLTNEEQQILLKLARQAVFQAASGRPMQYPDLSSLPPALSEPGTCFVTLTIKKTGALRGCIGSLEARMPLAHDVCEHAAAAALDDYRFSPVRFHEMGDLHIEISRLTQPVQLDYECPEELVMKLNPLVDGVVLRDGQRRSTYLPQVWEKLPDPEQFLDSLCQKMGGPASLWKEKKLKVEVYQVEEFHEKE